jgi:hypothetical protein
VVQCVVDVFCLRRITDATVAALKASRDGTLAEPGGEGSRCQVKQ